MTSTELDEDVGDIEYSIGQYYGDNGTGAGEVPRRLDGALRAIFEDLSGAIVALTTLVTGLAMNHVQRGSYLP